MTVQDSWTLDSMVEARRVRGLRERTLHGYDAFLRSFLRYSLGEDPLDPARLTPVDVVQFVTSLRDRFSAHSMKVGRTALRSLFRFVRAHGLCDERLELAIPAVAHWRMATLPKDLTEGELKQVLTAFDFETPSGRRDHAIVLCLSTLGLRPGEIAELHLEDIRWRTGTVRYGCEHANWSRRSAALPRAPGGR